MSIQDDPGRQLDSTDHIEDALDILAKSGFNYMLLVGTHEKASTIYSNLDMGSALMLDDWNENEQLRSDIRNHLEGIIHPE